MVKIVWTELSISDLKEIFDYIAEDSIRYASITGNKIYQRVQPIIGQINLSPAKVPGQISADGATNAFCSYPLAVRLSNNLIFS